MSLDPGTSTGWAVHEIGPPGGIHLVASGVKNFRRKVTDRARLLAAVHDWIERKMARHSPAVLVVEHQPHMHGSAVRVLVGISALALAEAGKRDLLWEEVSPGTWKKWARETGQDWWEKGDEADARAIGLWWCSVQAPKLEVSG